MINQEVKDKALQLRLEGYTYKQIASELGISVDWCKRNLTANSKGTPTYIKEIVAKATSPTGVTAEEAFAIMNQHNKRMTYSGIQKACMKENPNCLFRPEYLDGDKPNESLHLIRTLSDELYNALSEKVDWYMTQFPNTSPAAVERQIVELAQHRLCHEGLPARLEYQDRVVEEMTTRKEKVYFS